MSDKHELFKYIIGWIENHPKAVREEYISDFSDFDVIDLGERGIFIIPISPNKPIKILWSENPCPLNSQKYCEQSKLKLDGMEIIYECRNRKCQNNYKKELLWI